MSFAFSPYFTPTTTTITVLKMNSKTPPQKRSYAAMEAPAAVLSFTLLQAPVEPHMLGSFDPLQGSLSGLDEPPRKRMSRGSDFPPQRQPLQPLNPQHLNLPSFYPQPLPRLAPQPVYHPPPLMHVIRPNAYHAPVQRTEKLLNGQFTDQFSWRKEQPLHPQYWPLEAPSPVHVASLAYHDRYAKPPAVVTYQSAYTSLPPYPLHRTPYTNWTQPTAQPTSDPASAHHSFTNIASSPPQSSPGLESSPGDRVVLRTTPPSSPPAFIGEHDEI